MYERELKIATQAVKRAEPTFRKYFGTKTKVEMKEGNYRDLVSDADKKIQQDIKKFLFKKFSTFGFIGEEQKNGTQKNEYIWVLDPIDGTTNYLQGSPNCAISLALLKKGKPVVGIVYAPFLNQMFIAKKGGGSWLNKKKLNVGKIKDIKMAFGCLGWARDLNFAKRIFNKFIPKVLKLRVLGSSALGICYVAQGSYDFYVVTKMDLWDYTAAQIILEEAGGKLILSKKPQLQIAANKILAKKLTALLS